MSSFYYNPSQHQAMPTMPSVNTHNQHGNRSRRGARFGSNNNNNNNSNNNNNNNNHHHHHHNHQQQHHHHARSFKPFRASREAAEIAHAAAFRKDFEAARSFDLEDDEVFCPWHLLTDDDLHSIHSGSSDRSSSSDGSPDASPLQHQIQPSQPFQMSAQAQPHMPSSIHHGNAGHLKIHQPMAQRNRNAIPIVDPNSRNTSPPSSISPARQAQKHYGGGRRW